MMPNKDPRWMAACCHGGEYERDVLAFVDVADVHNMVKAHALVKAGALTGPGFWDVRFLSHCTAAEYTEKPKDAEHEDETIGERYDAGFEGGWTALPNGVPPLDDEQYIRLDHILLCADDKHWYLMFRAKHSDTEWQTDYFAWADTPGFGDTDD